MGQILIADWKSQRINVKKQMFLLSAGDKVLTLYVSALWWSAVKLISLPQEESMPAKKEKKEESESEDDDDDDDEPEPGSTLFVKNINFDTQEADLKEKFKKCGDIKSVSISKKKDVKNPGMSPSSHFINVSGQTVCDLLYFKSFYFCMLKQLLEFGGTRDLQLNRNSLVVPSLCKADTNRWGEGSFWIVFGSISIKLSKESNIFDVKFTSIILCFCYTWWRDVLHPKSPLIPANSIFVSNLLLLCRFTLSCRVANLVSFNMWIPPIEENYTRMSEFPWMKVVCCCVCDIFEFNLGFKNESFKKLKYCRMANLSV